MSIGYERSEILKEIANTVGTPTYVYDSSVIKRQIAILRNAFGGDAVFHYAMKANSSPAILRVVHAAGFGVDAVSPAEFLLAKAVGFREDQVFYSANNMSDAETELAAKSNAHLNVGELTRLEKIGQLFPGREVFLRMNLGAGAGHHEHVITAGRKSKFGISERDLQSAIDLSSRYDLRIVGLHQHIGSGNLKVAVVVESFRGLLQAAADNLSSLPHLRHINFGGGFGIPYRPNEQPLDMIAIGHELTRLLDEFDLGNMVLHFEPGRFVVAESGSLLVAVTSLKDVAGATFAGTDSGMNHLVRPAMYDAYHGVHNLSNPTGTVHTYHVVGNICESADYLARDRRVQEISEGDILAITDTGAYGMSMHSTYNLRVPPAEVWIDDDGSWTIIRKKKSPQEFVAEYLRQQEG